MLIFLVRRRFYLSVIIILRRYNAQTEDTYRVPQKVSQQVSVVVSSKILTDLQDAFTDELSSKLILRSLTIRAPLKHCLRYKRQPCETQSPE